MGKRQVEALAVAAAVDIEAFYTARRPDRQPADRLLVMQFDGKGIVMIPRRAADRHRQDREGSRA